MGTVGGTVVLVSSRSLTDWRGVTGRGRSRLNLGGGVALFRGNLLPAPWASALPLLSEQRTPSLARVDG